MGGCAEMINCEKETEQYDDALFCTKHSFIHTSILCIRNK